MLQKIKLTSQQALQRARQYCVYQERCDREMKDKLYSFGLNKEDTELIISQLIEENYLNEARFAGSYARGKFRMNQWGRIKILYGLKQKQVSEYCIRKAMSEIDEQQYRETINELVEEKLRTLKKEKNILVKKRKVMDYMVQKGFEGEIISTVLGELQV